MKKNALLNVSMFLVASGPLIYLALIWNKLPEKVALHYDHNLQPDRISDKMQLWWPVGLLAGVSILIFFIMQNIHHIDPKRKHIPPSANFTKLARGLVFFMALLNVIIITSAWKGSAVLNYFLFPFLRLLVAFIGNYMNNIKPNYFAGFRLPWTLSDNENWRRTHQFGSRLWFWGGLLFAFISLFIPATISKVIFIGIVIVLTIIPSIYSYLMFKRTG